MGMHAAWITVPASSSLGPIASSAGCDKSRKSPSCSMLDSADLADQVLAQV
jgi:hypothetical protein